MAVFNSCSASGRRSIDESALARQQMSAGAAGKERQSFFAGRQRLRITAEQRKNRARIDPCKELFSTASALRCRG